MTLSLAAFSGSKIRAWLVLCVVLLVCLAWSNRFVQDDAFISFRYAKHLVEGKGLVFNPGERVEGYTNFLWTLLIAAGMAGSIDPVHFSWALGLACLVLTLVATHRLAALVLGRPKAALLAVILLGTNYTFSAYATGGLETQLQACLCTAIALLVLRVRQAPECRGGTLIAISLLVAAALLVRLDSAVFLFVLFPPAMLRVLRANGSAGIKAGRAACLCVAPLVIVGAWLIWKLSYYGDVLPNTYYAKVGSATALLRGLRYCEQFVVAYWMIPFVFLAVLGARGIFRRSDGALRVVACTVVIWTLYVISVGGDFMEFRFFVPVLPLVFVMLTWLSVDFVRQRRVQTALVAVLLAGSLHHAFTYRTGSIESIGQLQAHVSGREENWRQVGTVLGQLFGGEEAGVVLATTAAGAIPYYSGLETVDMLGLCDRRVAREGIPLAGRAGHQRTATFDYMLGRGVNLVVGHPQVTPRDPHAPPLDLQQDPHWNLTGAKFPPGSRQLEIPIDEHYKITVLYLLPSERVDAVVRRLGLKSYPAVEPLSQRNSRRNTGQ